MPNAAEHTQSTLVKALYMGESGTGKTSSLCSLLTEGYKLKIYDFDNLLAPLIALARRECPDKLSSIEFMPFRDEMRSTVNGPICSNPRAFVQSLNALDSWEDGSTPAEWGPDTVAVFDSLTTWARCAYFWARGLQGGGSFAEGVPLKGFSPQATYHTGQQALMNCISMLTAESFNTNVIVIAHLKYMERDGMLKGFPVALGSAISPEIPAYFPTVILAQRTGERRTIRTASTPMIDLKNPRSFDMQPEFDMDTGLAEFFKKTRS